MSFVSFGDFTESYAAVRRCRLPRRARRAILAEGLSFRGR